MKNKKLLTIATIIMLMASTTMTTYAATPALKIPSIKIPDITPKINIQLSDSFWDNWFASHPIKIK